jgi:hypothetical protein
MKVMFMSSVYRTIKVLIVTVSSIWYTCILIEPQEDGGLAATAPAATTNPLPVLS